MVQLLLYGLSDSGLSTLFHLFQLIPHTTPLVESSPSINHGDGDGRGVTVMGSHGSTTLKSIPQSSNVSSSPSSSSLRSSPMNIPNHHRPYQQQQPPTNNEEVSTSSKPFSFSSSSNSLPSSSSSVASTVSSFVASPSSVHLHHHQIHNNNNHNNTNDDSNSHYYSTHTNNPSPGPPLSSSSLTRTFDFSTATPSDPSAPSATTSSRSKPLPRLPLFARKHPLPPARRRSSDHFFPIHYFLMRRHAFSNAVLKALPFELLSQIFVCFRVLIHDAEAKGYLYKTEEEFHQFLKQFTNLDKLKNPSHPSSSLSHTSKSEKPSLYCEYCHAMATEKALVVMKEGKLSCKQLKWRLDKTEDILSRMKKIHQPQQLVSAQRLRIEFLNDCKELWDNHLGLQHTFHSYTLFASTAGSNRFLFPKEDQYLREVASHIGNAFSAFPSIMEYMVSQYLLKMPSNMFGHVVVNDGTLDNSSQYLGEDIAHVPLQLPTEAIALINTMNISPVVVENQSIQSSMTDYKFKFNLPPLSQISSSASPNPLLSSLSSSSTMASDHTSCQDNPSATTTILITPQETPTLPNQQQQRPQEEHKKRSLAVLSCSFTTNAHTDYFKSDSTLLFSVNSHLYNALAGNHRGSATQEVVAAVRPLVLDKIQEQNQSWKKRKNHFRVLVDYLVS
ncbi:hypothetical protein FDP41_004587 [Naegleria fowleri]|uniref:Uncharacterized protein n=1 Tax=Naegleria fowleri TaxID=5763 RepID=A0A6A5BRC1_NAEFO|nr:uncharacterized protein FDP41_004587 [Naegleria fowleri]KAF0976360.1 hypothetical protein FDP41_004587 [Naegleria fowleri]